MLQSYVALKIVLCNTTFSFVGTNRKRQGTSAIHMSHVHQNWLSTRQRTGWMKNPKKKKHFHLSVNVFSTKVLIGDTIFTSPNGDGTAILRGHPSHAKVSPLAVQRKYLHFSVILRPWVMVRPWESNLRPPALQSNALLTELILPTAPSPQTINL